MNRCPACRGRVEFEFIPGDGAILYCATHGEIGFLPWSVPDTPGVGLSTC